ncbi:MAG: hypothetical protein IKF36_02795 [Bacilli bacterium]|nr:hypothetical protein [Bacilli bacterium]
MENIEITVKVNESKDSVVSKLIKNGFKQTSDEYGDDIYLTKDLDILNKDNIFDILNKSVIIRHHHGDFRDERKFLILKDKKYKDGKVTTEEIYSVQIDNIDNMIKILETIGFKELVRKNQYFNDYTKDDITFILEDVEGIGLLIEYENKEDFNFKNDDEIIEEKIKMYNYIKSLGIDIGDDYDIKKAYELIIKKYNL